MLKEGHDFLSSIPGPPPPELGTLSPCVAMGYAPHVYNRLLINFCLTDQPDNILNY